MSSCPRVRTVFHGNNRQILLPKNLKHDSVGTETAGNCYTSEGIMQSDLCLLQLRDGQMNQSGPLII